MLKTSRHITTRGGRNPDPCQKSRAVVFDWWTRKMLRSHKKNGTVLDISTANNHHQRLGWGRFRFRNGKTGKVTDQSRQKDKTRRWATRGNYTVSDYRNKRTKSEGGPHKEITPYRITVAKPQNQKVGHTWKMPPIGATVFYLLSACKRDPRPRHMARLGSSGVDPLLSVARVHIMW